MNVAIVCNENAGRALSCEELRKRVERAGHTVLSVAKPYAAATAVTDERIDLLVAAGGDGTVATAAAIASKISAALAILPLGTANNIAGSLGVNAPLMDLINSWSTAQRVPFDLGCARTRSKEWVVVEGVGGGLMPAGIAKAQADQQTREDMSAAAEVASAVRTFRDALIDLEPRLWTIVIDGTTIADEFLVVEVLNIRSVGPNLVFGPDADPSDGYFDVVLAREKHRKELLAYLHDLADGGDARLDLPCHRAREVVIASCTELHIDDECVDVCSLGEVSLRMERPITVLL
ncbi:MAG TPA: diacylglycerol kinase family protein [Vicinamibacterales bacterium]|nr:diacylglycerol kinase family protein [Vicinamibacterales bacterium]